MSDQKLTLPPEVDREFGSTLATLVTNGWSITDAAYAPESFGNWRVDLTRNGINLRLVKDRSQYMADGPVEQLRASGLGKAFNDLDDFIAAVDKFAAAIWTLTAALIILCFIAGFFTT
jgi:hypothetical protein